MPKGVTHAVHCVTMELQDNKVTEKVKHVGQEDFNTGKEKYQQISEKERYETEGHLRAGLEAAAIALLLVLTERHSRHELIWKIPGKEQKYVIAALDRLERKLGRKFREIFQSITMDNGSEFLDMKGTERSVFNPQEKRTSCYYAHPYSAFERGSNENANKLIRRFVPKGADIDKLSHKAIARIQR